MNIDREQEWQAQEAARQQERLRTRPTQDPRVARYRVIVRALRQPLPEGLPANFAQTVAARVAVAPDSRLEQGVLTALIALLALAAVVVAALYGGSWAPTFAALLPSSAVATNWAVALVACMGVSWALEQLRQRFTAHHA